MVLSVTLGGAQGVLTVTQVRSASTAAGTGVIGYSGDDGAAASASLASPAAVAYDTSGNLFLADRDNHIVREVALADDHALTPHPPPPGVSIRMALPTSAWTLHLAGSSL